MWSKAAVKRRVYIDEDHADWDEQVKISCTRLLVALCALLVGQTALASTCDREQRQASFSGKPIEIRVAPQQFTEVVFPETLAAVLPEKVEGLRYHENAFPDRLFFTVEEADYRGIVILQGVSGDTYHLRLAGGTCGDLTVHVTSGANVAPSAPPPAAQKQGKKLIDYMLLGETPPAYARDKIDTPLPSRLVMQQGSVKFYLSEIYKGLHYNGLVLMAVNEGRTPYRVALEAIDFATPELREVLGRVTEITMFPYDFRLGPAPEFAADAAHPSHQGLVFIVAEAQRRVRR